MATIPSLPMDETSAAIDELVWMDDVADYRYMIFLS